MLGDGLAKFTGSALDAFGVDDASDIASGVGTVGRFAQGVDGVIGGDLSKLGALSGQLGGVLGDDDGILGTFGGAVGGLAGGGGAGAALAAAGGLLRDAFDDDSDPVGVGGLAHDSLGGAGAGAAVGSLVNDDVDRSRSDDGFDINYLAGGNDDAGDAPDYQQAYDAPAFEQPVYEPPPTEFEQRMEAIDEVADTTDNFFDGL